MIVGITGTLGAGKGTVVEYLISHHGFKHFSVRAFLIEEIERRGMPVDRDSMVAVANELRSHHHPGYIVEQLYERAEDIDGPVVIESIRSPGEIDVLKEKDDFFLLAVDANQKLRYERIQRRGSRTDSVTFAKFVEDEKREMDCEDPAAQNIRRCMDAADATIFNDSTFDALYQQIEEKLPGKR